MGWPEEISEEEPPVNQSLAEQEQDTQEEQLAALLQENAPAPSGSFELASAFDEREEVASEAAPTRQSALEEFVASTASTSLPQSSFSEQALEEVAQENGVSGIPSAVPMGALAQLPQSYNDLQRDAQSLEGQAVSIQHLVSQLRSAMSVIEEQRGEF